MMMVVVVVVDFCLVMYGVNMDGIDKDMNCDVVAARLSPTPLR